MSKRRLAALAGVLLCSAVHAQTYEAVADWNAEGDLFVAELTFGREHKFERR